MEDNSVGIYYIVFLVQKARKRINDNNIDFMFRKVHNYRRFVFFLKCPLCNLGEVNTQKSNRHFAYNKRQCNFHNFQIYCRIFEVIAMVAAIQKVISKVNRRVICPSVISRYRSM